MRKTSSLLWESCHKLLKTHSLIKKEASMTSRMTSNHNHLQNYHQQMITRNEKNVQASSSSPTTESSQNPSVRVAKEYVFVNFL